MFISKLLKFKIYMPVKEKNKMYTVYDMDIWNKKTEDWAFESPAEKAATFIPYNELRDFTLLNCDCEDRQGNLLLYK